MRRMLLAALLLAPPLGLGMAPVTASAHAILVASQPANGSQVPAGPQTIEFRYNSRIDRERSRLTLEGDNAHMVLPLATDSRPDVLAAKAELTPGTYVVRWQVLAVDGHLTRGTVQFTVAAGAGAPR